MCLKYGELWPTSGWGHFASLGHPSKFQRLSRLGSVTARYSSSGRQPNFSVLNKGRHLYPARRPSRWASAHILVIICISLSLYYLLRCQYRWHGATYCYSHRPSCVVLSVSLFITVASPEKKAEPVEMPFGVGTQVGPRNNLLGVGQDPPLEWAILRRGVARCKV